MPLLTIFETFVTSFLPHSTPIILDFISSVKNFFLV
nr:MAG TPA: hypothetical protein [Caudoviricetes sp.]